MSDSSAPSSTPVKAPIERSTLESLSIDEVDKGMLLSTNVNVVVLGAATSSKHRFISDFIGPEVALSPTESRLKHLLNHEDGTSYSVCVGTNLGERTHQDDQCFRDAKGFIFLYDTDQSSTLQLFTIFRERIMRIKEVDRRIPMLIVAYSTGKDEDATSVKDGKKLSEYFGCLFQHVDGTSPSHAESCFATILGEVISFESGYLDKKPQLKENADDGQGVLDDDVDDDVPEIGIAVVGDLFVGKTSMIRKFIKGRFYLRYSTTTENHVQTHSMSVDGEKCILRIIDTPGLNAGEGFTKSTLMPIQGFILVYSYTSRASFKKVSELRALIAKCKPETKLALVLVGTKADDLLNRQVSIEEGRGLAKRMGATFFEVSLKDDKDVTQCFAAAVSACKTVYHQSVAVSNDVEWEFERAGMLKKQEGRKWVQRICTISESTVSFSKIEKAQSKGSIKLDADVRVSIGAVDPKAGYPFVIEKGGKRVHVAASSEAERNTWIETIRMNVVVAEAVQSISDEVIRAYMVDILSKEKIPATKAGMRAPESPSLSMLRKGSGSRRRSGTAKLLGLGKSKGK